MRADGIEDLDVKAQQFWAVGSSDFEGMLESANLKSAMEFGGCVDDLAIIERVSIYHMHLGSVWRTHREPIEQVYRRARCNVSAFMRRKSIE